MTVANSTQFILTQNHELREQRDGLTDELNQLREALRVAMRAHERIVAVGPTYSAAAKFTIDLSRQALAAISRIIGEEI